MKESKFRKLVCALMASVGSGVFMFGGCHVSPECEVSLDHGTLVFHNCAAQIDQDGE